MYMTFYGKSRVAPEVEAHIHESPASMTVPLTILAIGSVAAGWLGTPRLWGMSGWFRGFEQCLEPAFASAPVAAPNGGAHDASTEGILMGVSIALAIMGIVVARYCYHISPQITGMIQAKCGPIHRTLINKWYVDELYDFFFVNGFAKGGGRVLGAFDREVI